MLRTFPSAQKDKAVFEFHVHFVAYGSFIEPKHVEKLVGTQLLQVISAHYLLQGITRQVMFRVKDILPRI